MRYVVRVARYRGRRQLADHVVGVDAGDERQAGLKATKEAYWVDQRRGVRCVYRVVEIRQRPDQDDGGRT